MKPCGQPMARQMMIGAFVKRRCRNRARQTKRVKRIKQRPDPGLEIKLFIGQLLIMPHPRRAQIIHRKIRAQFRTKQRIGGDP